MKYLISYLIATLLFCGCKNDSQKQREKQLDTYEKLYQQERAKIDPKEFEPRLDSTKYEIIAREQVPHKPTMFYVLIKNYPLSRDSIQLFINDFRHDHCVDNTSVRIIDNKEIYPLLKKESRTKEEYLLAADHYIAASYAIGPDYINYYPYQDFRYKKYGGKNWKKEPIK